MTKPTLPLIRKDFDRRTGEFKYIATTPEPTWTQRWVGQKPVPFYLMMLAAAHARRLNNEVHQQEFVNALIKGVGPEVSRDGR